MKMLKESEIQSPMIRALSRTGNLIHSSVAAAVPPDDGGSLATIAVTPPPVVGGGFASEVGGSKAIVNEDHAVSADKAVGAGSMAAVGGLKAAISKAAVAAVGGGWKAEQPARIPGLKAVGNWADIVRRRPPPATEDTISQEEKAFAEFVEGGVSCKIKTLKGQTCVVIPKSVVARGAASLDFVMVENFFNVRPSLDEVCAEFNEMYFSVPVSIGTIDSHHILYTPFLM